MEFAAIWSAKLILVSLTATVVLAFGAYLAGTRRRVKPLMRFIGCVIPLVVIGGSAVMCVRGYVLDEDSLRIKRLFEDTSIALSEINSAEHNPEATRQLSRTWGNGGVYAYVGDFESHTLGAFKCLCHQLGRRSGAAIERKHRGNQPIGPGSVC